MDHIEAGMYAGHAVRGSEQYAVTSGGHPQIALDVFVAELKRSFTVFLVFSPAAASYSLARLRACGWKTNSILDLDGVDANEVALQVFYETFDGRPRLKVEISMAGETVKLKDVMTAAQKEKFAAIVLETIKKEEGGPAPEGFKR